MKFLLLLLITVIFLNAQTIRWTKTGHDYYKLEKGELYLVKLPENSKTKLLSKLDLLTSENDTLQINDMHFSEDNSKLLIFTKTQRVWRLNTKGAYYVYDFKSKKLHELGKGLEKSSLMFAKFSPNAAKVAYVSKQNIYVEDLANKKIKALTTDGTRKRINGTFDWAYEEEFACRDGFQWSPSGKTISFWQVNAHAIRDYYMINNTDSIYSQIIPVEYPVSGENPSPVKIGLIDVSSGKKTWINIPGDNSQQYIPRMEWSNDETLFLQQINRKQNESNIFVYEPKKKIIRKIFTEKDDAFIDVISAWENVYALDFRHKFRWINNGQEFLWSTDMDGWRHIYRISKDGSKITLVTKGNFDVMDIRAVDETNNYIYYYASPENATQRYLYKSNLQGNGEAVKVSPDHLMGTHSYDISADAEFAFHRFTNHFTKPLTEWLNLKSGKALMENESIDSKLSKFIGEKTVEFLKIKTSDNVELDAWMEKPKDFDPNKKYPLVFYVYTEPWGANVKDVYGVSRNGLYSGDMVNDGYIYVSIDNRGTPVPKGREWRKSLYKKIGDLNIRDQALAAKEILKNTFIDTSRVAVWGWSGGGTATLNLLFQHPEIYKTGISIAAVANMLTYDSYYQERYMGLPQEDRETFVKLSPIYHAKNLQGNLLYIHGTGDDNVHYNNAEMLINELIKHQKLFSLMIYPNRSHGIYEGEGTSEHLQKVYTDYLKKHCPPGGR